MGGITVDDVTRSAANTEIFGLGRQEGRQAEAAALTLRLLQRRCGTLSPSTTARIHGLSLIGLEALAVGAAFSQGVARFDVQGPDDLHAWLGRCGG